MTILKGCWNCGGDVETTTILAFVPPSLFNIRCKKCNYFLSGPLELQERLLYFWKNTSRRTNEA
jgi:hypothetical protein